MNNRQLVKQNYGHPTKINQGEASRQEILSDLSDDALRFMRNKHAKNTQNAYQSDARVFTEWCFLNGVEPEKCSTADIANFLSDQASGELCRWKWSDKANRIGSLVDGEPLAYSTIYRRWNGVKFALKQRGRIFLETELDVIKEVMQGIASEIGTEKKKVRGIKPDDLKLIFSSFDLTDHIDLRDRALLMLLFAGAFRRSEISAMLVRNVKIYDGKGMEIKLAKAKRKKNGIKKTILVGEELCPVLFLQEYMDAADIQNGYVFRRTNRGRKMLPEPLSGTSIYNMVKDRCKAAGLEGLFGGHSGRRGFVDVSLSAGKPLNKVMEMTGHSSVQTVQEYFDDTERWRDNAGDGLY